jgi:cytochrome oxidase assembly protein ShyY1
MLRLSYWQWERHLEKLDTIANMQSRLKAEPLDINRIANNSALDWREISYRRAILEGSYDFQNEIFLRNRTWNNFAGYFVITPFTISGTDKAILVNRGFVPYSFIESGRTAFNQKQPKKPVKVVLKQSSTERWFAPKEKISNSKKNNLKKWLRINIPKIQMQLNYPLLPVYADLVGEISTEQLLKETVTSGSDRDDILNLVSRASVKSDQELTKINFPVKAYDLLLSPGRHLGYVFEWIAMAIGTLLIGIILQFKRSAITT